MRGRVRPALLAVVLLGYAQACLAQSYDWGNYIVRHDTPLTAGAVCTSDGVFVDCATAPTTTINGTACTIGSSCTVSISGSNVSIAVGVTPITGGATSQLVFQDSGGNFDETANVIWQAPFLGLGTTTASAQLHIAGANAISAPAWTTNGIGIRQDAETYTDTSSSGTQSSPVYFDVIGQPTLAASNATTFSNAATMYIARPPVAGNNATITKKAALVVGSGNVGIGTTSPAAGLQIADNGLGFLITNSVGNYEYVRIGAGQFQLPSGAGLAWTNSSSSADLSLKDTGLSRGAAGKVYVGNGTQGDYSGTLIAGNVGIGTTSPAAVLDVAGAVKVAGTGSETCDAAHNGAQRMNPTTGFMEVCMGY